MICDSGCSNHVMSCHILRCDGSYLEDQDKWWLSGIYREVYLLRKAATAFIADYEVTQTLTFDETLSEKEVPVATVAALSFEVLVEGTLAPAPAPLGEEKISNSQLEVRVQLYEAASLRQQAQQKADSASQGTAVVSLSATLSADGSLPAPPSSSSSSTSVAQQLPRREVADTALLCSSVTTAATSASTSASAGATSGVLSSEPSASADTITPPPPVPSRVITLQGSLPTPRLWTAESPHLYTLVVSVHDLATGQVLDVESSRIGMREVRVGGAHNQLCVNRRAITIAGVNRHEFDSAQGNI